MILIQNFSSRGRAGGRELRCPLSWYSTLSCPLKARKGREMQLTAVLGPLLLGHLGRLCRHQKRQSGGQLKRPGRLGERSGRLWRCGGRERSCGIVKGRRETVYARVTRKVTESASPRAATRPRRPRGPAPPDDRGPEAESYQLAPC